MKSAVQILSLCLALILAAGNVPVPDFADEPAPPAVETPAPEPSPPPTPTPPPPTPGPGLEDVATTDWFYDYVRIGFRHGFFRGTGGRFEPNRVVSRAEFITMLGRLHLALGGTVSYENVEETAVDLGFTDVELAAFYAPYLVWATELEITRADAQGHFRPMAPISREEMAVFATRYILAFELYELMEDDYYDRGPYADRAQIANWADEEVHLLRNLDLMLGRRPNQAPGGDYFHPAAYALRSEAAALLARLFEGVFHPRGGV